LPAPRHDLPGAIFWGLVPRSEILTGTGLKITERSISEESRGRRKAGIHGKVRATAETGGTNKPGVYDNR